MTTYITLAVYCLLIVAASLTGGRLPNLITLTHKRMQILISFVGGLMLGVSIFHMLPHSIAKLGINQLDRVMIFVMLGMVVMFFLLRTFHFHNHDPNLPATEHTGEGHPPGESCDHEDHHHAHESLAKDMSWMGVFVGLSIHTMIDGMILGASLQADAMHNTGSYIVGVSTFIAILLHKPLDALSITTLMQAAHWPSRSQLLVNMTFAMMCPIGAALFILGASFLEEQQAIIVGSALAFSAGVFLCISLSDLLPEMEFHSHHRIPLSIALLLGISLAWGIRLLEAPNAHQPSPSTPDPVIVIESDVSMRLSPSPAWLRN